MEIKMVLGLPRDAVSNTGKEFASTAAPLSYQRGSRMDIEAYSGFGHVVGPATSALLPNLARAAYRSSPS
jgi:hypothetical protein